MFSSKLFSSSWHNTANARHRENIVHAKVYKRSRKLQFYVYVHRFKLKKQMEFHKLLELRGKESGNIECHGVFSRN